MGMQERSGAKTRDTAKAGRGGDYATGRRPSGWPGPQGEGNRDAVHEYNESQAEFAQFSEAEEAAQDAHLRPDAERQDIEDAERKGRSHARR